MHNIETAFANTKLGMVYGFLGFIAKAVFFAQEQTPTLLSTQNILESSVVALICTLVGLAATAGVNWVQRWWLGRGKKKDD